MEGISMRVFGALALVLILPSAGCQTDDLPPGQWFPSPFAPSKEKLAAIKAEWAIKDDETCRSYGAKPGTDIYIQCRMTQQQSRDVADNAAAAAAGAVVINNTGVPTDRKRV